MSREFIKEDENRLRVVTDAIALQVEMQMERVVKRCLCRLLERETVYQVAMESNLLQFCWD